MQETDIEYLNRAGFDSGRISSRYIMALRMFHKFINAKKIAQNIILDTKALKTAIVDYFVDIARVKEFHNITKTNMDKVYGYMAYWILRRKPVQVTIPFPDSEYINEYFVTAFIIAGILAEKNLSGAKCGQNASFGNFQNLLLYNLKYRPISQQSLELMIEAFFCGCDF